jgi:hypothetical protein
MNVAEMIKNEHHESYYVVAIFVGLRGTLTCYC